MYNMGFCGMVTFVNYASWTNHYMCAFVLSMLVRYLSMGMHQKWRFHIAYERMTSSGDRHRGWEGQVQDKHLEKIICLKPGVHLVIMDMWRCSLMKLSHSGVWGSKLWVFTKQHDQVKHSDLIEAWSVVIKIKRDAQGKGMALLGFPFTGLKVFVERPGYRIDSRTIKRGFRLGNLITSS